MIRFIASLLIFTTIFASSTVGGNSEIENSPLSPTLSSEALAYDVPLDNDLLEFIWQQCQDSDIPYDLVLALIKTESDFQYDATSDTADFGLMQINGDTMAWLAKQVDVDGFNPFNPYHNVTAGIWYLSYLRDYWSSEGVCDEQVVDFVLLSYNRGIRGADRYVASRGLSNEYISKVKENREMMIANATNE